MNSKSVEKTSGATGGVLGVSLTGDTDGGNSISTLSHSGDNSLISILATSKLAVPEHFAPVSDRGEDIPSKGKAIFTESTSPFDIFGNAKTEA